MGESFLGKTTIAGDLSDDGTLSITEGKAINAFPTQFLQNNPLAEAVNFFNGKVIIDKDGIIKAQTSVADQFKVRKDKSAGKCKILAGETETTIDNTYVEPDSIIIITPETVTTQTLSVSDKLAGQSFKVKSPAPAPVDIDFSYLIIGQEQAGN